MSEILTLADTNAGQLQFTTGKNGTPRINLAIDELPQFLVEAHTAVEAGRIDEAAKLLNEQNIETIRRMADTCRTDVMFMVAVMFFAVKDFQNSEIWFKEVLKRQPHALVYHELGRICMFTGRMSEAMEYRRKAIEADPNNSRICYGYATDLIRVGRAKEGVDLLRKAVELAPEDPLTGSKLLWSLSFLPDVNPRMLLDEHKKWAQIHAPVSLARTSHDNIADPDRRLRVGYISSNFKNNLFGCNFYAFLNHRNRESVEVFGYGKVANADGFTEIIKQDFDRYRDIYGVSDEAVVSMIEQDKIDILVNTGGGHEVSNGYDIMKYKPAPIQVDYGAINTTGMEQIDYRLTDSLLDPVELQQFYVEESVCLPSGFFVYRPPKDSPPVTSLPAVENGYVTFGSFNNNCKVNSAIMSLWAGILKQVADSRFILKFSIPLDRQIAAKYLGQFGQFGIEPERIEVHGIMPHPKHMELYGRADIALDTYPFNGCMTTLQSLWMGVPVVSLVGDRSLLSRTGLSILGRVGLEFFAASAPEQYVAKATALASKLRALAQIRASMRRRMLASSLCDHRGFARAVEEAYRKMWHRWCRKRNSEISSGPVQSTI